MAEKPWDIKTGPKTPEEERTEKIKAAIKGGTFFKSNKKEVGTVAATDAWAEADKLKRRNEKAARLAKPATDAFQKLKLPEK